MSYNDYTKYAQENRVEIPVEPVVESPVEIEPVAEVTVAELVEVAPVEPVVEIPEEPEVEPMIEAPRMMGRVIGCTKLNVRKNPKPRAEIVCEINCDTEVEIDEGCSTVDFYKICTASGIEGYCVKTYINVNPKK